MNRTPKANRLQIGLFGRRNVGKSSLLNTLTRQEVSLVSAVAGTTTDPVEKAMELLPLGPVLFHDTAGVDDEGELGQERVRRTRQVLERVDVALLVTEAWQWGETEEELLAAFQTRGVPTVVVLSQCDRQPPAPEIERRLAEAKLRPVRFAAPTAEGVGELKEALIAAAPDDFLSPPPLVADLVPPGELAVLVVPIDMEAPKGRLILPQVQTIRDLLDGDASCLVVKERELRPTLERLKGPPALVVTDSQAFLKVAADVPPEVPLTSFSILFARARGDLVSLVRGACAIDELGSGSHVLVAEACSHHPIGDDIGRVKIPRWLRQYVGGVLEFTHVQGHDFPDDLAPFDLVIHCGGCVHPRRAMLHKMARCQAAGVPITNYGLSIAYSLGIFERALGPFPAARLAYGEAVREPVGTVAG